ncbi:hypothetical protein L210DRAFT_2663152 [Boletus edulis BED1]|uniref:Uncharacterized protein n=1 Tax=Boletus edulis BED1 TaxID=1328754 RepID=A0AAD4C6D4_BOLED|nr:hypothetical protein L210DRAFT_2663152 [Boletus edulis BED1]
MSQAFCDYAGHSRHVWRDAYLTADCVRPPGPFLWQSKQDLENVLVSSWRVERNLRRGGGIAQTSRPTFKLREIRYTAVDLGVKLVFGRFLLIAFNSEVCCYDLNANVSGRKTFNSGGNVIYRTPTAWTLVSFHCVSAIDVEGHPFTCAVLNEASETTRRISIYLLHVEEQSEVTLDLLHQFEHYRFRIGLVEIGPRVIVIQGHDLDDEFLFALDVCTHTMFTLSPCGDAALMEMGEVLNMLAIDERPVLSIISTSTHVVIATAFYAIATTGWRLLFQAFALPPPHPYHHSTSSSIALSPSHRGLIPGTIGSCHTLRDAVIDPTTQDVLIAVQIHSSYNILRLSAAHASRDHEFGTITLQSLGPFGHSGMRLLHPSFHGTGRAFGTLKQPSHTAVSAVEYDVRTRDDDSEVDEAKFMEYPSILRFQTPRKLLDYDPYTGLLCLRSATKPYNIIEILDLAV